jgi:hypothetical protein
MPPLIPLFAFRARMFSFAWLMGAAFLLAVTKISAQDSSSFSGHLRQKISFSSLDQYKNAFSSLSDSNSFSFRWPAFSLPKITIKHPFQINNGNISYQFDYRSNIDTPFAEKNVAQHNLVGQMNVTAFNALPLNVNFFIRRTNSSLFADINDIRIDFNAEQYAQSVRDSYLKQLNDQVPGIKDSLTSRLRQFKLKELSQVLERISKPDFQQKIVECNEIINVPGIAESIAGAQKADSVRKKAREFIDTYQSLRLKEKQYHQQVDSLQLVLNNSIAKANQIRTILQGKFNTGGSRQEAIALLRQQGLNVPASLSHLLSLKRFSLGRSQLNYSELTAKNISVNGINLEYNSWYYFALAAGTVDYRFRDFILNRSNRKPQYMYLMRLGIGRLEKNYFILSGYRGKKQSYIQNNSNSGRPAALDIYGVSAEAKYRIRNNIYVITEIAQSSTPGWVLYEGQKKSSFFEWKDKSNKAYAVKLFAFLPRTATRLEGMYRYSGAAFQSFDRFQGNSAREFWYIKAEQSFWKRQLRLVTSIRKNEFSNPYIPVTYSSGVISKTIQLSFRKRNWPMLSAGLMPFSQLTVMDNQVFENRFQTFNAVMYHQYKVGLMRTSTTATFNKFYNSSADSGFIYFNAVNFYLQQYLFFRHFSISAGGSHSRNTGFELNVLEESIQFNLPKNYSITAGVKINDYNRMETQLGNWIRLSMPLMKTGWVQLHYENGLLPGINGKLVRNQMCNVMVTKNF